MRSIKEKRKNARVKLPIRQAIDMEMTLRNARDFCGVHGANREMMEHLVACINNLSQAIDARNRVVGLKG